MKKYPVAILGATGTVGQKVISMLNHHPQFYVAEVAASGSNVGKKLSEACQWRDETPLSDFIGNLVLRDCTEVTSPYAISGLPGDVAKIVEPFLANKGTIVSSNASTFRMDEHTPLLIPEINPEQIHLLEQQTTKGKIITNPNCSTVMLACALKPLMDLAMIDHISVVTLQAASGAGYPGVSSLDLIGNTIPFIGNEEDKIEIESEKILGRKLNISCHVNRVPVVDGHTVVMHVYFKKPVTPETVRAEFLKNKELYKVHDEDNRPQPRRDLSPYDMQIHIGRIKQGSSPTVIGLVSLGHNLVRGAAGAAIKNLEHYLETYHP